MQYKETTQHLINIVESDPRIASLLQEAINKGRQINPDRGSNPIQSLEDYYRFIDHQLTAMPWEVILTPGRPSVFGRMYQCLCYCYFINCMHLDSLEGENFFTASIQYLEPYRSWLIDYCRAWGTFLSSPESWNKEYEELMMQQHEMGMTNGWYESPDNWHSFNDFFSRRLASPDVRPIAAPDDDSVIVSPADCTPQGWWQVDADSHIISNEAVAVKSRLFTSVRDLIGHESAYCDAFANGVFTHAFLNVNDYHRYHFPVGGIIREVRLIPGDEALGGTVTWDANLGEYVVNSSVPGWQSIETRGLIVVETDHHGLVALLPVGMSQVSSVNFEPELVVGRRVRKGDPLGYFLFGGSDFAIVFQAKANITAPAGQHIFTAQQYGHF
ncbi:MAG: phosphatidylserine decarboxylase [Muribaculaceae bacterium]